MIRHRARIVAALLSTFVIGCGSDASPAASAGTTSASFPTNVWTWVDVPGTSCSDGSPTGFGVNPGTGPDVVFFLDGGGACWNYDTCFVSSRAAAGPVQRPQFEAHVAELAGTFADRNVPGNPLGTWTFVFVPYCTGDLHAGDREMSYPAPDGTGSRRWEHRGRVNVAADLAVIVPRLARPGRLVIGGSSAGGFGALLQYDAIRKAFGAQQTFLVDDSGPPLEGDALRPDLRIAWRTAWNLDPLLADICPDCADDFSRIVPQLVGRYSNDRIALLSSLRDRTMTGYFELEPDVYQAALLRTVQDRFATTANARTFLVAGDAHALLATTDPQVDLALGRWFLQMLGGDPAWGSVGP